MTDPMPRPGWSRFPGHRVTLDVDRDGSSLRIRCDAPTGARCRLVCAESCGAETWPCYSWDEKTDSEREHPMHDGGYCNVIEFVHAGSSDASEWYDGRSRDVATLGSVQVRWSNADESYVWRFPDEGDE